MVWLTPAIHAFRRYHQPSHIRGDRQPHTLTNSPRVKPQAALLMHPNIEWPGVAPGFSARAPLEDLPTAPRVVPPQRTTLLLKSPE